MALEINTRFLAKIQNARNRVKRDVQQVVRDALNQQIPSIYLPWNGPGRHTKAYGPDSDTVYSWSTTGLTKATVRALVTGEEDRFTASVRRNQPTVLTTKYGTWTLGQSTAKVTERSLSKVRPRNRAGFVIGRIALTTEHAQYLNLNLYRAGVEFDLNSAVRKAVRQIKRDLRRRLDAYWR